MELLGCYIREGPDSKSISLYIMWGPRTTNSKAPKHYLLSNASVFFKGGRPWFFAIRFFKVLIKKPDCLRSHKIGFYFENRVLIGCGLQKRATHSVFRGGQLAV
jgi:hypothetical protein